jgi:hypothetical protein
MLAGFFLAIRENSFRKYGCAPVPALLRTRDFERVVLEAAPPAAQLFRNEVRICGLTDMQWIEALINVSAFVGFIGVATHWPENPRDR